MNPALTHIHDTLHAIKSGIQKEIIGQDALIDKLIITFFAGGHALLECVPGLGKTKTIRTFARVLGLDTGRVSFTPDLLPSDLTGSEIYRQGKGTFEVRKGPIFTSILLADEINRTPPKVQSALLEAMEEKKVTIVLGYPTPTDEKRILMQETVTHTDAHADNPILTPTDLLEMIDYIAKNIRVDEKIYDYVEDILSSLRHLTKSSENTKIPLLDYGPSTRAGLALIRTSRIRALMEWRDYVMIEDIKYLAHDIIDHRIGLSYEASAEWHTLSQITARVLDEVRVP